MEIGSAMQFTEEHSNKDGLFKAPFSIAERPKKEIIISEPLINLCKELKEPETNESQEVVENFIIDTLNNNNPKDKLHLMRIEKELIIFLKSESLQILKFPEMSSYNRMLVHKVAAYFGLDHNVDLIGNSVIVSKTWKSQIPEKRFQDHIFEATIEEDSNQGSLLAPLKRSILKRNTLELVVNKETSMEKALKSLEEREEEYQQARARIFKDSCLGDNVLTNESETSEILKAIEESFTQDERDMLTIPPSQKPCNEIQTTVTTSDSNEVINQHNMDLLVTQSKIENFSVSASCDVVVNTTSQPIVPKEIIYVKSEKKKAKRSKSKGNLQVNDYNQNPLKHLDLNFVPPANNLHKTNPHYVASLLENLNLGDMKNICNFVNQDCKSHVLNQINYKQIPITYTHNYNYNREYVAPSVNLVNNNLLGPNIGINTNLNIHPQMSINPNHYSNLNMELNTKIGPNFIQIQPSYGPQKNAGSNNSILPIPTIQPFTTLTQQYTNPYNTQCFSIPAAPTSYKPQVSQIISSTTYSSWQCYSNSLNNLATRSKLGIFSNPPPLFSGACSTYNDQTSKNIKQAPPLPFLNHPNAINMSLPSNILNYQANLAALNLTKNQAYTSPLRPYNTNCYINPIATSVNSLTQLPTQMTYIPPYLNPHLLNKTFVPPAPLPMINQVKPSPSQNNFPKVPVPLMAQNINPLGLQPNLLKSNVMGLSALQQDIIKFQNSIGIHKPHHLHHGQGYNGQNINTKHGKNFKHNRSNESKKRGSTPKVFCKDETACTTPVLNPEAIKVLKKDNSKNGSPNPVVTTTLQIGPLDGALTGNVEI